MYFIWAIIYIRYKSFKIIVIFKFNVNLLDTFIYYINKNRMVILMYLIEIYTYFIHIIIELLFRIFTVNSWETCNIKIKMNI